MCLNTSVAGDLLALSRSLAISAVHKRVPIIGQRLGAFPLNGQLPFRHRWSDGATRED